jgi:hypothetical protein
MSNVGARRDLPRADFGAFEGELVRAGTLQFSGQRPAPRLAHEGDTVYLLVQTEVREVKFSRNADGDLVRRHVLRVVEAAEAPATIQGAVITVIRSGADLREGREPLPFADLTDEESEQLEAELAEREALELEAGAAPDPEAEP